MIMRLFILSLSITMLFSCSKIENKSIKLPKINSHINDSKFVLDSAYPKGDVRRYGIVSNEPISQKKLSQVIKIANLGIPITFPKGYYKTNIVLKGITDAQFTFNNVTIAGFLKIINKDSVESQRINIRGNLHILDKLFIKNSAHISFNKIQVITDTLRNINNKKIEVFQFIVDQNLFFLMNYKLKILVVNLKIILNTQQQHFRCTVGITTLKTLT